MKVEQLAYFQYQSLASNMLVNANEFQTTREGRLTTLYVVTVIDGDKVVTTRPGTRGEAIRQAEEHISRFVKLLDEVYSPSEQPTRFLTAREKPDLRFEVSYKRLADGKELLASFDDQQSAIEFWDMIVYLRNHYRMLSSRPR